MTGIGGTATVRAGRGVARGTHAGGTDLFTLAGFTGKTRHAAKLIEAAGHALVVLATAAAGLLVAFTLATKARQTFRASGAVSTPAGAVHSAIVRAQRITGFTLHAAQSAGHHGHGVAYASITAPRAGAAFTHAIALAARASLATRGSVSTAAQTLRAAPIRAVGITGGALTAAHAAGLHRAFMAHASFTATRACLRKAFALATDAHLARATGLHTTAAAETSRGTVIRPLVVTRQAGVPVRTT